MLINKSRKTKVKGKTYCDHGLETQHNRDDNYPLLIYNFSAMSMKMSDGCFVDIEKLILKSYWIGTRPNITQTIWRQNKVGGTIIPNCKAHTMVTITKIVW